MAISLRTWYDEPGDPLFIPVHMFDHSLNLIRFSEDSGLSADNLVVSNLVTFAIPRKFCIDGPRGVEGIKAEFLAHPLAWLPMRLAGAYCLERDEDGTPTLIEGKDAHMVRIAVEMLQSGLYNEPEGKWIDCFALMSLDPEDPQTLDRARAWLAGGDDLAFDTFRLDDYLSHDEMVAFAHAQDMMEFLYTEAWAIQSHSLNQLITDFTTGQVGEIPPRTFGRNIATWAMEGLPDEALPEHPDWTHWDEFDDELEALDEDDESAVMAVLERMGTQLWAVREHYWALREANHAAVEAEMAEQGVSMDMLNGNDPLTEWPGDTQETEDPWENGTPQALTTAPGQERQEAQVLALPSVPFTPESAATELEDPFTEDAVEIDPVQLEDPFAEDEPVVQTKDESSRNAPADNFTW